MGAHSSHCWFLNHRSAAFLLFPSCPTALLQLALLSALSTLKSCGSSFFTDPACPPTYQADPSVPLHLSLSSSCSWQFFLHTLPKNLICVLSFTVIYELWLDYQICAWSIYLFIFPELAFSISSFLLEFFILDVPLSSSLERTLLEEVYYLPFHWGFLLFFLFLLMVYFPSYTE